MLPAIRLLLFGIVLLLVLPATCLEYETVEIKDLGYHYFYRLAQTQDGDLFASGYSQLMQLEAEEDSIHVVDCYTTDQVYTDLLVHNDTLFVPATFDRIDVFSSGPDGLAHIDSIELPSYQDCSLVIASVRCVAETLFISRNSMDETINACVTDVIDITDIHHPVALDRIVTDRYDEVFDAFHYGGWLYVLYVYAGLSRTEAIGEDWQHVQLPGVLPQSAIWGSMLHGDELLVMAYHPDYGYNRLLAFSLSEPVDSLWYFDTPIIGNTQFLPGHNGETVLHGNTLQNTYAVLRLLLDDETCTVVDEHEFSDGVSRYFMKTDTGYMAASKSRLLAYSATFSNEEVCYQNVLYDFLTLFASRYLVLSSFGSLSPDPPGILLYDLQSHTMYDCGLQGKLDNPLDRSDCNDVLLISSSPYHHTAIRVINDQIETIEFTSSVRWLNADIQGNRIAARVAGQDGLELRVFALQNGDLVEIAACTPSTESFSNVVVFDDTHFALFENYVDNMSWHFFRYIGSTTLEQYASYPARTGRMFRHADTLIFGDNGAPVLDISNIDAPQIVGCVSLPQDIYGLDVSWNGGSYYCLSGWMEAWILDDDFHSIGSIDNFEIRFLQGNRIVSSGGTSYSIAEIRDLSMDGATLEYVNTGEIRSYPNPFNPETTIRYAVPQPGEVTVAVYNIRGQRVATLLHEHQTAGQHELRWNAVGLPSGVYLVRLESARHSTTGKVLLLK